MTGLSRRNALSLGVALGLVSAVGGAPAQAAPATTADPWWVWDDQVDQVLAERSTRVPTAALNQWLGQATDRTPPAPVRDLTATVCWLAERELQVGARLLVQHGTSVTKAIVKAIEGVHDLDFPAGEVPGWVPTSTLRLNDIGRVRLALASPLPIDPYKEHRTTGAFILVDEADGWTLGAGMAGATPLPTGGADSERAAAARPTPPQPAQPESEPS